MDGVILLKLNYYYRGCDIIFLNAIKSCFIYNTSIIFFYANKYIALYYNREEYVTQAYELEYNLTDYLLLMILQSNFLRFLAFDVFHWIQHRREHRLDSHPKNSWTYLPLADAFSW